MVAHSAAIASALRRHASTLTTRDRYRILVIGGGQFGFVRILSYGAADQWVFTTGSGGLAAANQIYNRFKAAGKALKDGDVAIVDAAEYHYYQV
jgi:sulfide:quinone oxidoreductase